MNNCATKSGPKPYITTSQRSGEPRRKANGSQKVAKYANTSEIATRLLLERQASHEAAIRAIWNATQRILMIMVLATALVVLLMPSATREAIEHNAEAATSTCTNRDNFSLMVCLLLTTVSIYSSVALHIATKRIKKGGFDASHQ